jgi:PncC family amidohydrolase
MWKLAAEIGEIIRQRTLTLSIAESLTGGWVSAAITGIPGSSDYFTNGIVAYSNQAKISLLGVKAETLESHGAVSPFCSREMARGIRRLAGTDLALATTGIAGPSGGSVFKPVGLVFMTAVDGDRFVTVERRFSGDRLTITISAALEALSLLKTFLTT